LASQHFPNGKKQKGWNGLGNAAQAFPFQAKPQASRVLKTLIISACRSGCEWKGATVSHTPFNPAKDKCAGTPRVAFAGP
jgi:hypothetical protein